MSSLVWSRPSGVRLASRLLTQGTSLACSPLAPSSIVLCSAGQRSHCQPIRCNVRCSHDDLSLIPKEKPSPKQNILSAAEEKWKSVPHDPPFGLTVLNTLNLTEEKLLELFKAQNPTEVSLVDRNKAQIMFGSRKDLINALMLDNTIEVLKLRLWYSKHLRHNSKIEGKETFQVHLSNLPPGMTEDKLCKIFKDLEPSMAIVVRTQRSDNLSAFMSFNQKHDLVAALERSGTKAISGMVVKFAMKKKNVEKKDTGAEDTKEEVQTEADK